MKARTSTQATHKMRAPEPVRRLVIKGGLHDAAALDLAEGAYLIGSADHCQIVLRDKHLEDEVALLCLSPTGSFLRALTAQLSYGGRALKRDEVVLCAQDVVLAVGEDLRIAVVQRASDLKCIDWSTGAAGDEPPQATELHAQTILPVSAGASAARGPSKPRSIGVNAIAAVGLVLFGLGLAIVTSSNARNPAHNTGHNATAVQQVLVGILGQSAVDEVRVSPTGSSGVVVQGYAPSAALLQQARARVDSSDVRWSVFVVEELMRYASDWLAAKEIQADVRYRGHGKLAVVVDPQVLPKVQGLLTQLQAEVPGVSSAVVQAKADTNSIEAKSTALADAPAQSVSSAGKAGTGPYALSGFSGVNATAQTPYITSGSTYIFRGGTLTNGMSVRDISPARVVVNDQATQRAHVVMVR